jgi:osmotically-inducible protein OsmY
MLGKLPFGFVAVMLFANLLTGCVGAAVGGGAMVTTAAVEERGIKGAANDLLTHAHIAELWLTHSEKMYTSLGISVVDGRALLTGKAAEQQMRLDAVRLAWQATGIKEVINEIAVTGEGGVRQYARDSWVTTQLMSKLLFDGEVRAINYSVETVAGTIYLMGVAQDQTELDRVANHARNIPYAQRVVNYVRVKDDPARNKT